MSTAAQHYDCIISNGAKQGVIRDVAIIGERIARIGDLFDWRNDRVGQWSTPRHSNVPQNERLAFRK